jgi:hypothetical protein
MPQALSFKTLSAIKNLQLEEMKLVAVFKTFHLQHHHHHLPPPRVRDGEV